MAMLDVDNTIDNQHWRFCADEVEVDGRFLRDDELTYEQFGEFAPDAMLPTGTRVVMPHLWGHLVPSGISEATDYVVTLPSAASVQHVVHVILSQYNAAMQGEGGFGRFYFIEAITRRPNGDVEIVWGT